MATQFKKAMKSQARLRLGLIGPSGSGKTYTALAIGSHLLQPGQRMAVIDSESGSASLYADLFDFDVLELDKFHPQRYIDAIEEAQEAGYGLTVIDSLSHAWVGKEGALELVEKARTRAQSNNSYTAWRDVTPLHNALIDAIIRSKSHIIATMRAKTEHVQEKDERGKTVIRKIGLAPVQRDGMDYEFTVTADLDMQNNMIIGKTRCPILKGQVFPEAGKNVANILREWLETGLPDLTDDRALIKEELRQMIRDKVTDRDTAFALAKQTDSAITLAEISQIKGEIVKIRYELEAIEEEVATEEETVEAMETTA
jgi:hypothetical protein